MKKITLLLVVTSAFVISLMSQFAAATTYPLTKETVISNHHPMALWHKKDKNLPAQQSKGPILLLHGRTWSALPDFDLQVTGEQLSVMDNLVALGFDVWALDARGYGETPRDKSGWNTPDKAIEDVANVLRYIQEESKQTPVLFGWSYGSMTAQLMVQKHPQLAKAVVLYGYPLDPEKVIEKQSYASTPPKEKNTAKNAASDFIVAGSISEKAIDSYVNASLQADPYRADWKDLIQWNQLDASKITIPVLLLQGEHDPLAQTAVHAKLFVKLPNANKQWIVLAGGDHAALLETPKDKLVQSVADFVVWLGK